MTYSKAKAKDGASPAWNTGSWVVEGVLKYRGLDAAKGVFGGRTGLVHAEARLEVREPDAYLRPATIVALAAVKVAGDAVDLVMSRAACASPAAATVCLMFSVC
jgi:hypothetical protein